MRIAIISDIHAHSNRVGQGNSSLIICDSVTKKPISHNPLSSLSSLIKRENLSADLLLLPGDFCDRSDANAFEYVWKELKEISKCLKTKDLIGTVGNHDVIRNSPDPFRIIKERFHNEFPSQLYQECNGEFWKNGFCTIKFADLNCDVLIINSSFHHIDAKEAEHGKIDEDQLLELRRVIEKQCNSKFKIALFHHHPIAHERMGSKTYDLMVNGSELMEMLDRYDFAIAIHGHKHDPRLKYSNSGPGSTIVFASGSFSCVPNLMLPGAYNTFHMITLENILLEDCEKQGVIETWNFVPSKGWVIQNSAYLPSRCGFGCTLTPQQLAERTIEILKRETSDSSGKGYKPMPWKDFVKYLPQVNYVTQSNFETYGLLCKEKYNIVFSTELPQSPEMIYLNL